METKYISIIHCVKCEYNYVWSLKMFEFIANIGTANVICLKTASRLHNVMLIKHKREWVGAYGLTV